MWNSSSQVWFSDPLESSRSKLFSQQCYEGYVPSYQSWDTDWQWKSNGWSRTLSPNQGSGVMLHGGHSSSPEACSQKKPICLTNVLQEAVTVIPITSSPLVHNLWRTGSAPETLPLYTRHTAYPVQMFHLGWKLVFFLWNTKFSLKNRQTTAIQTEEDIFLKMNKVSLSLQDNLLLFRILEKLPPAILSWGVISDSSAEPREQLVRDEAKRKKNR